MHNQNRTEDGIGQEDGGIAQAWLVDLKVYPEY